MTAARTTLDPQPTWYRLPDDAWAMIRAEYLDGATAKVLAERWKVSPTSIYRHACAEGWTKQRRGAAVFEAEKARAEAGAAAAAADAGARGGADPDPAEAMTPEVTAKTVMLEAAKAVAAGRYGDAERLVRLAGAMGKLAEDAAFAPAPAPEADRNDHTPAGRRGWPRVYTPEEMEDLHEQFWLRVEQVADGALNGGFRPIGYARAVARWRAEALGPEVAEHDRAASRALGEYDDIYEPDGAVKPGLGAEQRTLRACP